LLGSLTTRAFIHVRRHMVLMKISYNSDCLAVVNSDQPCCSPVQHGAEVAGVPRKSMAIW
jgi:hypothetical protein